MCSLLWQRVVKADIVNYSQEPVTRTVNPPRSSMCAIQWTYFPLYWYLWQSFQPCTGPGLARNFILTVTIAVVQLEVSKTCYTIVCWKAAGSFFDWQRFKCWTTHFEKLRSLFLWIIFQWSSITMYKHVLHLTDVAVKFELEYLYSK